GSERIPGPEPLKHVSTGSRTLGPVLEPSGWTGGQTSSPGNLRCPRDQGPPDRDQVRRGSDGDRDLPEVLAVREHAVSERDDGGGPRRSVSEIVGAATPPAEKGVERPGPRSTDEQVDAAHQLRIVGAALVEHGPPSSEGRRCRLRQGRGP